MSKHLPLWVENISEALATANGLMANWARLGGKHAGPEFTEAMAGLRNLGATLSSLNLIPESPVEKDVP